MSRTHVTCTVNGDEVDFLAADDTSLLDALREELGLTGAKEGCGTGDCGACSILLDGRLNCSCLVFAPEAEGRDIVTVEGLADGDHLHPLQQAFLAVVDPGERQVHPRLVQLVVGVEVVVAGQERKYGVKAVLPDPDDFLLTTDPTVGIAATPRPFANRDAVLDDPRETTRHDPLRPLAPHGMLRPCRVPCQLFT